MRYDISLEFDMKKHDPVKKPKHYDFAIQPIDFIEALDLGFHLANVIKYTARAGKKNPEKEIEDLEKAAFYLNRKISNLKKQNKP